MDLRIMKIKFSIIPFPQGIGYIEYPSLRLERHPQPRAQKTIVQMIPRHVILRPARVQKTKKIGIQSYQIPVFDGPDHVLRRKNALLVKPAQQTVTPNKKKLVPESIGTAEYPAIYTQFQRRGPRQREIMRSSQFYQELIGI